MDTRFVTRLTVVTALAAASVFGSLAAAPAPAAHALPMVTDDGGPSLDLSPQDEADLQLLKQIVVDRFSATPTVVRPFDVVTLSWQVRLPEDPRAADITLYAGGSQVGTEGSAMVQITSLSARPGLVARLGRVQRVVAAAQVSVDTSACQHIAVSEAMLTAWVNSLLDQLPEEHRSRLYDRNAVVTISESGVRVRVTAGVSIDNWTDPDLTIDMLLGLGVHDGKLLASYRAFDVDVDFPWYANLLPPVVSTVVNHFLADAVESGIRDAFPGFLQQAIDGLSAQLPSSQRLMAAATTPGQVELTFCPAPSAAQMNIAPLMVAAPANLSR